MTVAGIELDVIGVDAKGCTLLLVVVVVLVTILVLLLLLTIRATTCLLGVELTAAVVWTLEPLATGVNEIFRALLCIWEVSEEETTTKLGLVVVVVRWLPTWPPPSPTVTAGLGRIGIRCTICAVRFVIGLDLNTIYAGF